MFGRFFFFLGGGVWGGREVTFENCRTHYTVMHKTMNIVHNRPVARILKGGGEGGGSFFVGCGPWPNASVKN